MSVLLLALKQSKEAVAQLERRLCTCNHNTPTHSLITHPPNTTLPAAGAGAAAGVEAGGGGAGAALAAPHILEHHPMHPPCPIPPPLQLVSVLLLALKHGEEAVAQLERHLRTFKRPPADMPPGLLGSHHAWVCRCVQGIARGRV